MKLALLFSFIINYTKNKQKMEHILDLMQFQYKS